MRILPRLAKVTILPFLLLTLFLQLPAVHATDYVLGANCDALILAISAANIDTATGGCPAGDSIIMRQGITVRSSDPFVIEETGGGTSKIVIDGKGGAIDTNSQNRIFTVRSTGELTLKNMTLSNGSKANGGAIIVFGKLTLDNVTINNSSATTDGGAIKVSSGGTAIVMNSTITGNSAASGGGILVAQGGTLTVTGSTISSNSAGGDGAGIHSAGTLTVKNSAIALNIADANGAGIYINTGSATIENSTFYSNTAFAHEALENYGGGIFVLDGTATVKHVTISGNSAALGAAS